ncbi:M48 family metalloprotease, partial [Candidatus Dependentiae bacterium]|nr:M48 family metalloprotease [Candidatus Dependentiae bacterium]
MNKKMIHLVLCFIILTSVFSGCSVNPVTGKKELSLMSESMENSVGSEYYPVYTQISNGEYPDKNLQNYISSVGLKMAKLSHRPNLNYEFNVVNSSVPNAYAIPGGKISITRGLLVKMSNEDQLAAVLAHELGHVNARHTASQYTKSILTQALMIGAYYYMSKKNVKHSELYLAAGSMGMQLMLLKYSRDHERQADDLGLQYMVGAGYNPVGFVDIMKIINSLHDREPSKWEVLLSTHPLTTERINDAQSKVNSIYTQYVSRQINTYNFNSSVSILKNTQTAYESFDKGVALIEQKKFDEAEKYFSEAIKLYNKDSLFYSNYANLKLEKKEYSSARQYSIQALSMNKDLFMNHFVKGIADTELRNYNAVINDL